MMIYRQATPADAAACAAIEQQQPLAAGWGLNGFESELKQPYGRVWCACEQAQVVGFLALRAVADSAEILNVAILPNYTRRGIGYALLARALTDLQARKVSRVTLEVAADNRAAQALYEKGGLTVFGQRKDFYGIGKHALLMGKDL